MRQLKLVFPLLLSVPLFVACSSQESEPVAEQAAPAVETTAATPASVVEVPDASEGVEGYRLRATAVLEQLVPGGDLDAARRGTESLMELGAGLVPDFVARHPHCAEYLDAALQVRTAWKGADLETLERDYHHDGALPKIENSGVCYHMKDLVVHPATVLAILAQPQPDLAEARKEIEEVVSHAGFVEGK